MPRNTFEYEIEGKIYDSPELLYPFQQLNKKIVDSTTNKSRFIESFLLDYFNKCNLDTSKIKL